LELSNHEIVELINDYERQARAAKEEALKMAWYMRGGLSYEDAMSLGYEEREIIGDLIKKNLETTKESGLPFF
jgi:hypothetical protein